MQTPRPPVVTLVESIPGKDRNAAYAVRHSRLSGAGRYERLLAEGGTGAVLLVEIEVEGQSQSQAPAGPCQVAVKLLRDDLLGDPTASTRFRREVATSRKLSHRLQTARVVPCLDAATPDDPADVFSLSPYYPEGTLHDLMENADDLAEGLRLLSDAVEGLQGLHGHGYIHRDFCPRNILVSREGGIRRALLGDLGAAVPFAENTVFSKGDVEEEMRLRVGHPGFSSPATQGTVEADLFGVGATLYWLVSGSNPTPAADDGPLCLPPRDRCRRGVTASLHEAASTVIVRLTTPRREGRFVSAAEARAAILELAGKTSSRFFAVRRPFERRSVLVAAAVLVAFATATAGFALTRVRTSGSDHSTLPQAVTASPLPVSPAATLPTAKSNSPAPAASLRSARALVSRGRLAEAETALRSTLASYPSDPEATGLLSILLSRRGPEGLREAELILTAALDRSPARGDLRLALARVLSLRGESRRAISTLAAAPGNTSFATELASTRVTILRTGHQVR